MRWKQARVALTSTDPEYREKLDAIKRALSSLAKDEAFFSIDELGPVAVKIRAGRSLQLPASLEEARRLCALTPAVSGVQPARRKQTRKVLEREVFLAVGSM